MTNTELWAAFGHAAFEFSLLALVFWAGRL
jgi:hypothetical protein